MTEKLLTIDEQFEALGWKNPEREKFPNLIFNTESAENKYKRLQVAAAVGNLDVDWLKITSNRIQEMITDPEATEATLEDAGALMFGLEEMAPAVKLKTLRDCRDMKRLLIPKNFLDRGYYSSQKRKPFYFNDYDRVPEGTSVADLAFGVTWLSLPVAETAVWIGGGLLAEPFFGEQAIKSAGAGAYLSLLPTIAWSVLPAVKLQDYLEEVILKGGDEVGNLEMGSFKKFRKEYKTKESVRSVVEYHQYPQTIMGHFSLGFWRGDRDFRIPLVEKVKLDMDLGTYVLEEFVAPELRTMLTSLPKALADVYQNPDQYYQGTIYSAPRLALLATQAKFSFLGIGAEVTKEWTQCLTRF